MTVLHVLDCESGCTFACAVVIGQGEFLVSVICNGLEFCGRNVDTTPSCTRSDAHCALFFQCGHTALAQGTRNLFCAFLCAHFHLVVMSLLDGPLGRFPPVTSSPASSLSRPSASSTSLGGSGVNPVLPLTCLANPTPHTRKRVVLRTDSEHAVSALRTAVCQARTVVTIFKHPLKYSSASMRAVEVANRMVEGQNSTVRGRLVQVLKIEISTSRIQSSHGSFDTPPGC